MKLRSPTSALLWELWRVTRAEAAWKLALPIALALAALGLGAAFGPANDPKAYQDANDNDPGNYDSGDSSWGDGGGDIDI